MLCHTGYEKQRAFQCKGYGNCRMVFTRSEHLARHQRKHTGEKPYNCIIPGCRRKFSRIDNMMQHTQTHLSVEDERVPDLIQSKKSKQRTCKKKSKQQQQQQISKTGKKGRKTAAAKKEEDDDRVTMLMDELFLLSDSSLLSSDEEQEKEVLNTPLIGCRILPHLANYLVNHPHEPPENYFFQYYHRLSMQDLSYPIKTFIQCKPQHNMTDDGGIHVTIDEFEALQGLSQFTCQF